jgi:hypothetical protein
MRTLADLSSTLRIRNSARFTLRCNDGYDELGRFIFRTIVGILNSSCQDGEAWLKIGVAQASPPTALPMMYLLLVCA